MGCYNVTCHLSNLAIQENERVIAFPVCNRRLVMYPFRGTYDEYGGLYTIDPDPIHEHLLARVQSCIVPMQGAIVAAEKIVDECNGASSRERKTLDRLVEARKANDLALVDQIQKELDEMECANHATIFSGDRPKSLNDLCGLIAHHGLMIYDTYDKSFNHVYFIFVRESIWDRIKTIPCADDNLRDYIIAEDAKHAEQRISHVNAMRRLMDGVSPITEPYTENELRCTNDRERRYIIEMQYGIIGATYLCHDYYDIMKAGNIHISTWFRDRLTVELLDVIVAHYEEMRVFHRVVTHMRKEFDMPSVGSQTNNRSYMLQAYKIFSEG